jgi:uncharacterized protein
MVKIKGAVDADAHVDETDATWEYMTAAESRFKPLAVDPGRPMAAGDTRPHRLWLIDGRIGLRRWRSDERTGTTEITRELVDINARVRHMDELGVDVQVIYPTLLLHSPTANPEVEVALCRSYNRWLADRTPEANGRLRWVVVPPVLDMEAALEELRFGKEHGACGVYKRAVEAGGKLVCDPYFFPLYEEAERLDMPICIHTGNGDPNKFGLSDSSLTGLEVRPQIGCMGAMAMTGVPERFPRLRMGVIEAMASWVPHVIADMKAKNVYGGVMKLYAERPITLQDDFLRANRFYVTCQTSDDVPYLLKFGAEDSLLIGTDYTHADQAGVLGALDYIEELADEDLIPQHVAHKILVDNPRTFYGI